MGLGVVKTLLGLGHFGVMLAFFAVLSPNAVSESSALEAAKKGTAAVDTAKVSKSVEFDEEDVKTIRGKEKTLTIPIGISRTLEFPFEIGPIYLTDPSLFEFRRVRDGDKIKKLLLIPKNAGLTDMTVHDVGNNPQITYLVRVTREDMGIVMSQLEELLGDIEGLKIKSLGGTIVLDGEILLPKDMIRIIRVLDAVKGRDAKKEVPIRNLATISKITMNVLAERIEKEIGSPEITVRVINNIMFIEGTADSDTDADRAITIAKTYLPEAVVEKTRGDGSPEVRPRNFGGYGGGMPTIEDGLKVRPRPPLSPSQDLKITVSYVELKNDYDKSFSFNWRPLASGDATARFDTTLGELTSGLVATVTSLFPKLQTAKSHGHARILKQQQIVVKDRADQFAGIESSIDIYTRVPNERGESILQAIPVQNVFKVKAAVIQGSDSIDMSMQVGLNSLVGGNNGPPQVAKNQLQTQIIIKNGDSAAIGGYAIDEAVASYNKDQPPDPGANSVPIFNLTRSKGFGRIKQQYIIFVTPEIMRTASTGTDEMTRKFRLNAGEK